MKHVAGFCSACSHWSAQRSPPRRRRRIRSRTSPRSRSRCCSPPARRPTSPRGCWPTAWQGSSAPTCIVVNRPGAGGAIGYRTSPAQKPDGYVAGLELELDLDHLPFRHARVRLQGVRCRWRGAGRVAGGRGARATRNGRRSSDLIADGKARPKAITVGNSGVGSHTHISSVALFQPAGVEAVDVPFGAAQVVPSLLGGQVDAVVQLPAALAAARQERAGALPRGADREPRPRASRCADRARAGLRRHARSLARHRGAEAARRRRRSPRSKLAIRNTVESKEFVQACERLGARPAFLPSGQFGALIAKEDAYLAKLMGVDRAEEVAAGLDLSGRRPSRGAGPLIVARA